MEITAECMALWREAIGNECEALIAALAAPSPVSIRLHPQKQVDVPEYAACVPWCSTGRYLSDRPSFTLDPYFHAGAYYVQEASSMFPAQLKMFFKEQCIERVLDLCAAPGGKSTLLAETLPPEGILVTNEVIQSRVTILAQNMAKWGYPNVVVTQNDARDFVRLPHYFDALLVDAPCSGEGMFRKEPKAIQEWSLEAVELCAQRQRRIVADVWEALRPGGYLIYSPCTFNRKENEEVVDWICSHLGATPCPVPVCSEWGVWVQNGCYRFLPHRLKGEGFCMTLLQKKSAERVGKRKLMGGNKKISPLPKQQSPALWVQDSCSFFAKGEIIKALPAPQAQEMIELENRLRVIQSGVAVARIKGRDLIPDADLALSSVICPDAFAVVEVDLPTAQRYLARESFTLANAPLGYLLIQYKGSRLGFAKNVGTRINNLYPLNRRILKQLNVYSQFFAQ